MAAMFAGSLMAAVVSGTAYQIKGNTLPENWTSSNTWSGSSTTSYFLLNNAENYLQTEEFCQNGITSIVVNARKYGGPSADQLVISVEWIPTTGDAVLLGTVSPSSTSLANYTIDDLAAVTANTTGSIKLSCKAAASGKGSGLQVLTINYTAGSCGDDPQPETQTVYLNGGGSALWNQADAEFFAHTWGGAEAVAVKMTLVEGDVYSAAIPADNANVVFVRMAPESSAIDWDNLWNKTEDLTIEGENNLYTITAWGEGDGNKVCAGAWSVYGEGGGDTPEPPVAEKDSIFFVNVANWGAVRVHLWGGSAAGTEWPGVEMTQEAEQINGHDVYKFVADEGAYANCIFNNNDNGAQTDDLDWNSGKYFYDGTWYAKESIPSADPGEGGGETTGDAIKLTFCYYNSTSGDGSNVKTLDAIFDEASRAYVDEVTTSSNVYAGRKYKDDISNDSVFSNLKFGTQSGAGELAFALANETEVDSIVIRAAMYSDTEGGEGFSVNGTAFTLSRGNKKFEDKVWKPTGKVSSIDIVQTKASKGRFYLTSITIYPKTQGGGDDPQPETQTVYLNGGGSALWNQADAEFFAHTWGGAEAVAVKMTLVEGDVYSAAIPADNANVVFVRMAPESSAIDWDNLWNKTEDLTIEGENNLYTITAWGEGDGNKVCAGAWSVYGEGGGDTPEPPVAEKDSIFFVNVANWGAVRVHLWGGSAAGTEWPGVEMTQEAEQINGHDVYKFVADEGAYANCIFNNNDNGAQTDDLTWNSGMYYYVDAWYAKEDIPTVQPEDVVFTVNVPEGTDSVFIAGTFNGWTFEKMNHVEGLQYTITKNIVKDGIEYKYTAGKSWDYVEIIEGGGNRTWTELDVVTEWKAVPQAPFEKHDFFITGNAALVGEELAWNPNAIPVDGNSYVLHLGAGTYEMKIVLDSCGASNCQQWFGCERLSDEQVEGVACSKVGNIEFALAGEEDVTVTVDLTDTIITLTGNFYNIQMVDIRLVLSPEWTMDNAKFAAVTWRDGQEMENDGVFTDWFVGTGDTVVGQIPEDATQIAFARFAPEVVEPSMNPDDPYFWNHSDKLIIEPSMIYTITGGDVPGRNFSPGYWGERPEFIADGYFLLGTFNEWTPSAAYEFSTPDNDGQRKVTVALEENDQLKVAEYYRGYHVQWFPAEAGDYIVDADHAGSAQDVYFREDYGGADDWHAHCIYVVDNGATAIDNTAIDAKAEKMLRNGMILIIKGDKTYNIMGQIVK